VDIIRKAGEHGVEGVELRPEYWRDKGPELGEARAFVEGRGLLVTYATRTTLFGGEDGGRALRDDIDDARALGAPQLRVFQGPAPADDDSSGWAAAQEVVAYASAQGVVIALENYSGTPGGRAAEIARVLDRIQSPALGTNIDIGNYAGHGEDVPAAIRLVGERAVSAHLKDQDGVPGHRPTALGAGILPLPDILAALDHLPQRILYCFEFDGGGEPDSRIERSLAYLRGR
jgi:sugar phosphate isomerase/epimerase